MLATPVATPRNSALPTSLDGTRLPWLDVLRGVAVVLVLFHHLGLGAPTGENYFYRGLYALQSSGWCGVDIFFILSGFLVSGILFRQYLKTGKIRPGQFLVRRGFKIYPAFWLMIIATLVTRQIMQPQAALRQIIVELLFLQNYFRGVWTHTWSLAVEEHCYLGLCLLLSVFVRWNSKSRNPFAVLPVFVLLLSLIVFAVRMVTAQHVDPTRIFLLHVFPTHLRCDTFFLGVLLGYWFHFSEGKFFKLCERQRSFCLVVGVVCLLPVLFFKFKQDRIVWTLLFSTNAVGGALLVMWALGSRRAPGRIWSLVATIGKHSYSIYLWHVLFGIKLLVWAFLSWKVPGRLYTFVPLYFIVSIGTGMLMSYLIERPSLYLRELWFPESGRSHETVTGVETEMALGSEHSAPTPIPEQASRDPRLASASN